MVQSYNKEAVEMLLMNLIFSEIRRFRRFFDHADMEGREHTDSRPRGASGRIVMAEGFVE